MFRFLCHFGSLAIALCLSVGVSAAPLFTAPTTITNLWVYTDFGGGDVAFQITASSGGCYGFWLRAADPGFKSAYASLMAMYTTQTPMAIYADDSDIWTGSGNTYCKVRAFMHP